MKPSLYIVTVFLVWFATSLAGDLIPVKQINIDSACGEYSKPTNNLKIGRGLMYVECKHVSGVVDYVTIKI